MSFSKEEFMGEVQKYPVIYDKFSQDFKNIDMKKNAWSMIAARFDMSVEEAVLLLHFDSFPPFLTIL